MFQAHKDKSRWVRWCTITYCVIFMQQVVWVSGSQSLVNIFPLIMLVYYSMTLFGVPITTFIADRGLNGDDVQGGTAAITFMTNVYLPGVCLVIAINPLVGPLMKSIVLSLMSVLVLTVIRPILKRAFGANWVFVSPGVFMALELGQAAIFLCSPLSDPQLWLALMFQMSYAFLKNSGRINKMTDTIKAAINRPTSAEMQHEKRCDLAVMATAQNFSEILCVSILILLLLAEKTCTAAGLSADGGLAMTMAEKYRESGIVMTWHKGIASGEILVVLCIILAARIATTYLEQAFPSPGYGPKATHVSKYVGLILRDGPLPFRVVCVALTMGTLLIGIARIVFYGQWRHEML